KHGSFEALFAILVEARRVELHDGAEPAVRCFARRHEAIEARFAIAKNGGTRVSGAGLDRAVEPVLIPGGDQDGGIDAAEGLGIGVVDDRRHVGSGGECEAILSITRASAGRIRVRWIMHDWTKIDPNDYHHFHGRWIFAITDALNGGLLPNG